MSNPNWPNDGRPNPPLAPLTAKEFEDGCGYSFRGVWLCEDERGDYVYAYSHVDKATMIAAVHDYDNEMAGYDIEPHEPEDVRHVYAVTVKPADDPDGWWISWHDTTAETPGTFPLTVVNR